MPSPSPRTLIEHFGTLKDPRIERKKLHPLNEVLLVIFCGGIAGCESWRDFELFGRCKLDFLKKILPFKYGAPSKDTYQRVMSAVDVEAFKSCFVVWVRGLQEDLAENIHLDGKSVRRSFDKTEGLSPIHLVSAFASGSGLVLGQEKVEDHSNEIKAIPKLLEILYLKGAIVTIDAMGCQKDIAAQIVEGKGDYVLALKDNQGVMFGEMQSLFADKASLQEMKVDEQADKGHGRREIRKCYATEDLDWWQAKKDWKGLRSVAMVESTRIIGEKETTQRRFYISSLAADAQKLNLTIRSHWAIENTLHWTLDMTFREDESRIRNRVAAENMALVRKFTFNLLKMHKASLKRDVSIKGLRKQCGWDNPTLETVVRGKF